MMLPFVILLGWDVLMINIKACFPQLDGILKEGGRGETQQKKRLFILRHFLFSVGNAFWFFIVLIAYIKVESNAPWLNE